MKSRQKIAIFEIAEFDIVSRAIEQNVAEGIMAAKSLKDVVPVVIVQSWGDYTVNLEEIKLILKNELLYPAGGLLMKFNNSDIMLKEIQEAFPDNDIAVVFGNYFSTCIDDVEIELNQQDARDSDMKRRVNGAYSKR